MRRRNIGIVTALALVGVLAACGSEGTGGSAPPSSEATAPTSTVGSSPAEGETEVAVVEGWISALADGDLDRAWALTHPDSQEAFGGRSAFGEAASGLAEGFGAWASVEDRQETWTDLDPTVPDTGLVVLQGTLRQEGTTTPAAAEGVVVRTDGDEVLVDPFEQVVDRSEVRVEPAEGATVDPGAAVRVWAPGGPALFLVVGGDVVASGGGTGNPAPVGLEAAVPSSGGGPVAVSLVVVAEGGGLQAESFGYVVDEGP